MVERCKVITVDTLTKEVYLQIHTGSLFGGGGVTRISSCSPDKIILAIDMPLTCMDI